MTRLVEFIKKHNIFILVMLFLITSILMYNSYKSLAGYIANGFKDGIKMLTMVLVYFVPVICFYFYFYDRYIKRMSKLTSLIYSSLIVLITIFNIVMLSIFMDVYIANAIDWNAYQAMIPIPFSFPTDAYVISILLLMKQVFNIIMLISKKLDVDKYKDVFSNYDLFRISPIYFSILVIVSILVMTFFGMGINGLKALENIGYNPKYIFMLLLVIVLPLYDLVIAILLTKKKTIGKAYIILIISLLINVIFIGLTFVFEAIQNDFMINIGKPLFAITFAISIPIEMIWMLLIAIFSFVTYIYNFIRNITSKQEVENNI